MTLVSGCVSANLAQPYTKSPPAPSLTSSRPDIQALRGISVLYVVLYHGGFALPQSGFLGVDVFFVISGFLITGQLKRQIDRRSLSIVLFYARRIKRLWPSLYFTLLLCSILGTVLLTTDEYSAYLKQLIATVGFYSNVLFWRDTNYFHPNASFSLLLHTWSLSVEEQYYLFVPLALIVIPRKITSFFVVFATVLSLCLYLLVNQRSESAAFFLFPTRAWELCVGSCAAYLGPFGRRVQLASSVRPLLWSLILILPCFHLLHWSADLARIALSVSVAGLLLIESERPVRMWFKPFVHLGDVSYAWYLLHWPLFALAHCLYLTGILPGLTSFVVMGFSYILALLVTTYVEQPLRHSSVGGLHLLMIISVASALVVVAGFMGRSVNRSLAYSTVDTTGVGGLPALGCFGDNTTSFDGSCVQAGVPQLLVWGDSFAAHLVPGLIASGSPVFAQASKGQCGPFLNFASVAQPSEFRWTEGCLSFNRSVIQYIQSNPNIKVIVISARYSRYVDYPLTSISYEYGKVQSNFSSYDDVVKAFKATVFELRKLKRRLVIVSPPPQASFEIDKCYVRRDAGLPILGKFQSCLIQGDGYDSRTAVTTDLIERMSTEADVPVIWLDAALCHGGVCQTQLQGKPLYRDRSHLSATGSIALGKALALGSKVWLIAK